MGKYNRDIHVKEWIREEWSPMMVMLMTVTMMVLMMTMAMMIVTIVDLARLVAWESILHAVV